MSQTSLKTLRNMSLVNSCSIVHNNVSFQEICIDLNELDKKAARMLETCISFHTFTKDLRDPSAYFFSACFFPYHRFVFDGLAFCDTWRWEMHLNVHICILQFFDITFENPFKLIEALMFSEISILSEKLVTAYVDDFVFYFCISVEFQCHAKAYYFGWWKQ